MSTIKSQDEDLTLNAHGSGNDIKFQSNGVEKASISDAGLFTSTTIDATALTSQLPSGIGIGVTPVSDNTLMQSVELGAGSAITGYKTSGAPNTYLTNNVKFNSGAASLYKATDEASRIVMDSSGKFYFDVAASGTAGTAISWTNAMTIDNSGAVTKPLQPAFQRQSTSSQNNITADANTTVIFGDEIFDQNADVTSTTFTAPVTGKYFFSGSVRLSTVDKSFNHIRIQINTSNRLYKFGLFDPDQVFSSDGIYWCLPFNILADMDSSDTAYISIFPDQGASITDIIGSAEYTFWSGHLVC